MRPTTPDEPDDAAGPAEQGGADDGGRVKARPARPRVRRDAPAREAVKACKLHLPESVFDLLHLAALKKKTTASELAASILRRGLPRLSIVEDGPGSGA